MSRGYNRVVLMGNLARDPDVRFTPTKQKVARITVAIGRQWKNKVTGELQSHTDFVPVAVWGPQADVCERYLRKGRPVLVEGRISVRDFDDLKTGQRRWVTEVVADNWGTTTSDSSSTSSARRSPTRCPRPTWAASGTRRALKTNSRSTSRSLTDRIRPEM